MRPVEVSPVFEAQKKEFCAQLLELINRMATKETVVMRKEVCVLLMVTLIQGSHLLMHPKFRRFLEVFRWKVSELRSGGVNPVILQIAMNYCRKLNICEFPLEVPIARLHFKDPYCSTVFPRCEDSSFLFCPKHHQWLQSLRQLLNLQLIDDLVIVVLRYLYDMAINKEQWQELLKHHELLTTFPPMFATYSFKKALRNSSKKKNIL
jgi:hypothetical protein